MHTEQRQQRKRIGLIGILIVVVGSGLLLAPSLLYPVEARPAAQPTHGERVGADPGQATQAALRPTPPPLPTIAVPTRTAALAQPSSVSAAPSEMPVSNGTTVTTHTEEIAAHLAKDLSCLRPDARHAPELDAQAAERAKDDTTPLPQAGVIQLEEQDGQRFLLGADMAADLQAERRRCGETLLFGLPPLEWLSQGSRFGIGVAQKAEGLIIVVVTAR